MPLRAQARSERCSHISRSKVINASIGEKAMFSFSNMTRLTSNAVKRSLSLQYITPGSRGTRVVYASSNTGTGAQAIEHHMSRVCSTVQHVTVHRSGQTVTTNREEEKLLLRGPVASFGSPLGTPANGDTGRCDMMRGGRQPIMSSHHAHPSFLYIDFSVSPSRLKSGPCTYS